MVKAQSSPSTPQSRRQTRHCNRDVVPTMMANREKNSEMAGGRCSSVPVKRRNRPYYSRRCKEKKSSTSIESLPYELLFDILLHLSAEDIYKGAMLVSRKWYNMIRTRDFIEAHLRHSTPGLLVENSFIRKKHSCFLAIRQGRIEVSKFTYTIQALLRWDSCNGLLLEYYLSEGPPYFHVINPATKQIFEIPRFRFSWRKIHHHWWSIACSSASKEYKVVRSFDHLVNNGRNLRCDVVTIGVGDKSWRRVRIEHLSPASKDLLRKDSITTGGYIHCMHEDNHTHVLTLNVETEIITENPIPQGLGKRLKRYLSTGKSLSMFVLGHKRSYDVWEMKSETGEWTEMYKIEVTPHRHKLEELYCEKGMWCCLTPVGWLKYGEVVVLRFFRESRFHVAYNVCTHEIEWFELVPATYCHKFKVHTNSLVGLV